MTLSRSTPSVLRAASTAVDCAVGVAKQVAVGGTTLAILGVLGLPLLWDNAAVGGGNLRVITLDVRNALAVAAAVLSSQTAVGVADIAGGVDPAEVDVGRGEPGESAKGNERGPHFEWRLY